MKRRKSLVSVSPASERASTREAVGWDQKKGSVAPQFSEVRVRELERGGKKEVVRNMSSPRSPREDGLEEMETEMSPEPTGKANFVCVVSV